MKPKVYLETSVPSYLTAWLSRDLVMAAHQQITREWWDKRKDDFDLYVSQIVLQEAAGGDASAAARRMELLRGIPALTIPEAATALAEELVKRVPLPDKAALDALHITVAAVNGMQYLVTWNCKHIANATYQPGIAAVCRSHGYEPPVICTPEELLGE